MPAALIFAVGSAGQVKVQNIAYSSDNRKAGRRGKALTPHSGVGMKTAPARLLVALLLLLGAVATSNNVVSSEGDSQDATHQAQLRSLLQTSESRSCLLSAFECCMHTTHASAQTIKNQLDHSVGYVSCSPASPMLHFC